VVVVLDSDKDGRERGERLRRELVGVVQSLRVIDLAPDRDDGYDVSDWLDEGYTVADLQRIVQDAAEVECRQPQED